MTIPSGEAFGRKEHFSALGFELHYQNMRLMSGNDIVMPSIGGAGSSLLGNAVIELGLHYVDLTKETLLPDGSSRTPTDHISRRIRSELSTTASVHAAGSITRFMKTHLPAEEFHSTPMKGVWLLVRDPRDALYSWYRYHRAFAERPWEVVPDTFEEFLEEPFFTGVPPVEGWCSFYDGWVKRAKQTDHFAVLRFEDLKVLPQKVLREALRGLGIQPTSDDLARAVERSSFEAMQAHEEQVTTGDAKIMRSGKVGGWHEWMTPRLTRFFSGNHITAVAKKFGYDLSTSGFSSTEAGT